MSGSFIVSTDLDGTLLDHHSYSYEAARCGLRRCHDLGVPVIINTSKTYAEVVSLQNEIGLDAPLIVENGSALIAAEHHWLTMFDQALDNYQRRPDGARQLVFGVNRDQIIAFISETRKNYDWMFEGFNDWTPTQISQQTGLDMASAEQASLKEFSEPFIWNDSAAALTRFIRLAEKSGLTVLQGGRFYHLQGNTDKAKPLNWLKQNGRAALAGMSSGNCTLNLICLGDSDNDVAMLNSADYPVCVRSPNADFPAVSNQNSVYYTQGFGPVGWSEAVLSILA